MDTFTREQIEEAHKQFKDEFGIHFKNAPSELELVGGFLEDTLSQVIQNTREDMKKRENDTLKRAIKLLKEAQRELEQDII